MKLAAVIGAGGKTSSDAGWQALGMADSPRAIIPFDGKPLLYWGFSALAELPEVAQVVITGAPLSAPLPPSSLPVRRVPDQGSLLGNALAGAHAALECVPDCTHLLWVSVDVPLITPSNLRWLLNEGEKISEFDMLFTVISNDVMEARFPASRRTYTKLTDLHFCGGDVHLARPSFLRIDKEILGKLIDARKNPLNVAKVAGWGSLLRLFLGRMSKKDVENMIMRRLGLRAQLLPCPYPEMGMDIDKPHQYEMVLKAHKQK